MAGQGKIARLPHALKEQVNQRLLNGESAPVILRWLNPLPESIKIWTEYFEGAPATENNLSEWRRGGYQKWLKERESVENTKSLAAFAARQAAAGGGKLSAGLQAILAGHIMEGFEVLVNTAGDPDKPDDPVKRIAALGGVVSAMRNADTAAERAALDKEKVAAKKEDQKLAREKFEKQTVEAMMKWAQTKEAQAILNSGAKKSIQMAELRTLIFGKR
jgi:hypothetical protein